MQDQQTCTLKTHYQKGVGTCKCFLESAASPSFEKHKKRTRFKIAKRICLQTENGSKNPNLQAQMTLTLREGQKIGIEPYVMQKIATNLLAVRDAIKQK